MKSPEIIFEEQYKVLENNFLQYKDLLKIKSYESNEEFAEIPNLKNLWFKYFKDDMKNYFDWKIVVRKSVLQKLYNCSELLKVYNPNLKLIVTYWYRTAEIQQKYYNKYFEKVKNENHWLSEEELIEITHRWAANPEVAWHPTWWAVDVILYDTSKWEYIDMGTMPWDYSSKKCYTNSPEITKEQKQNRVFLSNLMKSEGFAPYLWEWWHFSYWDKEHGAFYKLPIAKYQPVSIENVKVDTKEKVKNII